MREVGSQRLQVPRIRQHVCGELQLAEARLARQQLRHICGRGQHGERLGRAGQVGEQWSSLALGSPAQRCR